MEVIQDKRLSKNLGLFIEGIICNRLEIDDERIDTRFYKMKTVNEVRDSLRIINVRKHPIITAYRNFINETGLKLHRKLFIKEILRLLGLRKKSIPENSLNDIIDAIALTTLVSVKALDISKIKQPLIIRYSIKGETFREPKGSVWSLRGSEVVISDSNGSLVALIPFWVSLEHSVKAGISGDIALLAFGVKGIPKSIIKKVIRIAGSVISSFYPRSVCKKLRVYQ